jgi:hypothetical protein
LKTIVRSTLLLVSATALLALTGCAPTSVNVLNQYTGPLPQPNRLLVYNFAVSPDEVTLDQGISAEVQSLAGNPQPPWTEKELQVGHAVSNALAGKLVAQLRSLGYPAERAAEPPGYGATNAIVIEGQLTSVNQGNRAARVVIGLGVGHSDVKTFTQVYDIQPYGRRLVEQFSTDARSGFKPGMAETEGASAAAGHWAVGLAVGAGLSVASEMFSANVEADADRTAKEIAQQLNNYFMSKGWVPTLPPQ